MQCPTTYDTVLTKSNTIAIVYGTYHPPGRIVAYPKYIITNTKTEWCRTRHTCYHRLPAYNPRLPILAPDIEYMYDSVLGANIPTVSIFSIFQYRRPNEGIMDILKKSKATRLEEVLMEFIDTIRSYISIPLSRLGITGSLLVGIHNDKISDIDIVVYGCEYMERIRKMMIKLKLLSRLGIEDKRLTELSSYYGISYDVLKQYFARYWRRGFFKGKIISLLCAPTNCMDYRSYYYYNVGWIKAVMHIEPGQCGFLETPGYGVGRIVRVLALNGLENRSINISPRDLPEMVGIEIYDNLLSSIVYDGGLFIVSGLLTFKKGKDPVIKSGIVGEGISSIIPYNTSLRIINESQGLGENH